MARKIDSRRTQQKRVYYVDGNTVRKEREEQQRIRYNENSPLRRKRRQEQARRRTARNRERALYMNPVYVTFLMLCTCAVFAICGVYVHLQSEVNAHMSNIATLENEVLDLQSDNDERLQRIETSVDLEQIRERAMNELGMVYPSASQIIYYTVDESDGMTTYTAQNE